MASGRTSCTVGAFGTAEVYNNASGGASSVTLYATSTDRTGCFNISVNISDASITPQSSSTIYCSCAGKCSCLTYGHVANIDVDSSGNYTGHVCYSPTTEGLGCCFGLVCFFRCTGDVICPCCTSQYAEAFDHFAPLPWFGSIENHNPCFSGTNLLPKGENGSFMTVYNLSCFKCHGGSVEFDRALEWNAAKACSQFSRCFCCCPDRDGCCGAAVNAGFRAAYGVVGTGSYTCSLKNVLNGSYTADYWGHHRYMARIDFDGQGCVASIFTNTTLQSCQGTCPDCFCCCSCNTSMANETIHDHCYNIWCRHMDASSQCPAQLQCCLFCQGGLVGGIHQARAQRLQIAGCNVIAFDNPFRQRVLFRARKACCNHCPMFCGCNDAYCSRFFMCYCLSGTTMDGSSAIKWGTYDCSTGKNYYLWWHDGTPDWNGIYTIDDTQRSCIYDHTINCVCTCLCYSNGDEVPTTLMTKAADVPSVWASNYSSNVVTFTNAHSTGPNCWVTLLHDWNEAGWSSKRYSSTDLINWTLDNCTSLGIGLGDCLSFSGTTDCIDITTSCYYSLCNSGQIENKTEGLQLERTGIVTSNGDRIYVCNCSTSPVSINVWGYEE